jgi:tetratricopeptide (TPR) repeat protein
VAYLQRARAHAVRKAYDQAVADYTQVLRLDPKYAWAYYSRGNAYFALKAYDRAVADYSEALRLDPEKAKASYLQLSSSFGPTATAVLTPKVAWAHYNRALAYENLGDTARARQDREAAVRLDPTLARN